MAPTDFLRLLYNSRCLIGNSSVGIRECSFLGVPVVNIGSRQSGRDRGQNVIDVDYSRTAILTAVEQHLGTVDGIRKTASTVMVGQAGESRTRLRRRTCRSKSN